MDNGYVCCGEYLYGDDAAEPSDTIPSQRVTEQDAREIIKSLWVYCEISDEMINYWLKRNGGRALLAKLNEVRNDQ